MTRLLRQVDDRADILTDPTVHWPLRPGWICNACGGAWPCAPLRCHLLATMAAQDIGIALGAHYPFAVRELNEPPEAIHHRLFGWIRAAHTETTASAATVRR